MVVDAEVNVHDHRQVLAAMAAQVNPGRNLVVDEGPPDPLDAATPAGALGSRLVIDATAKLPAERGRRRRPAGPHQRFHPPVGHRTLAGVWIRSSVLGLGS